jgi:hypothetical protein
MFAVVWDFMPCGSCKNIPEDGILHSHHRENLQSYLSILHQTMTYASSIPNSLRPKMV